MLIFWRWLRPPLAKPLVEKASQATIARFVITLTHPVASQPGQSSRFKCSVSSGCFPSQPSVGEYYKNAIAS
ncbi:hypothetical protein [Nostoc sp. FACHB-888]|uniref:hypothetical protein n=1 Tax=Nostoc sp. FACHB-888 TaxID=2692842 RepID=UPI00168517C9|nr:hypothetical protein [Nostoc sp. FACHB-888]MBD2245158.1 hypothetical protein [Nostoc sp. FACHB-888]